MLVPCGLISLCSFLFFLHRDYISSDGRQFLCEGVKALQDNLTAQPPVWCNVQYAEPSLWHLLYCWQVVVIAVRL
jgi:hypothetical protein